MSAALNMVEDKPARKSGSYVSDPFAIDLSSLNRTRGSAKKAADFQFGTMAVGTARATDYSTATVIKAKAKVEKDNPGVKFKVFFDTQKNATIYARVA